MIEKIGLGGGCHWCTEGVFQSLVGIEKVKQGWIASTGEHSTFSEAVIVHFNPEIITLTDLVKIHCYTHASTSNHSMRHKYRSAVYTFSQEQKSEVKEAITKIQLDFEEKIITLVLPYGAFKLNQEDQLNYLYSRPESTFCQTYIHPKLKLLMAHFSKQVNYDKIDQIKAKNIDL